MGLLATQFNLSEFQAGTLYTLAAVECYRPQPDGSYSEADLVKATETLSRITANPPRTMASWLVVTSHGVGCESKASG